MVLTNLIMTQINKAEHPVKYHEYIQSQEWRSKVEKIKQERGNRCQLCSVSGIIAILNGHHNTYERLGSERDLDITILCKECHAHFHTGENKPGNLPLIDEKLFSSILRDYGITFTNDDPYRFYGLGKMIIQNIVDGFNSKAYDYYNKINIHILDEAISNSDREDYIKAKASGDWQGFDSERDWRSEYRYWVGWKQ